VVTLLLCVNSSPKCLWRDLNEAQFDTAEFDKLFSKASVKVKSPTSKSSEVKKAKVVSCTDASWYIASLVLMLA